MEQSWSTVEIAAMTCVFPGTVLPSNTETTKQSYLNHYDPEMIRERYMAVGPVAETLFDPSHPIVPITSIILGAFKIGILSFITMQPEWVSHQMFILRPRSQRERHLPSYEFLSHSVVQQTTQLGRYFDAVRAELFDAFEVPETRSAAGKLVECVLHGALMGGPLPADKKIDLPESLGGGEVVATLELVGKAQVFVLEAEGEGKRDMRPLYLRPQASTFATVDAIIVTDTAVALVQSSVIEPHSHVIKTLLQILSRLSKSRFKEAVRDLPLVYCVVGTDFVRVRGRMQQANSKLMALKALSAEALARELRIRSIIAHQRVQKLEVRGYTLHLRDGLTEVTLAT
ncbi:hypothetical protein B0H11DRAFT_957766 [Mycena galericulata]|nr:hypothetical protein B0H11DRAFT_957766 [Mycena galericulata]